MSLLLYAGLLYLLGISILLMKKPTLMFDSNGTWKEFGLGRSKERYTWMPFWLFSILWAIFSYLIVLMIATHMGGIQAKTELSVPNVPLQPNEISTKSYPPMTRKKLNHVEEIKSGYFVRVDSEEGGIPKYIYLGKQIPNLVYHDGPEE